MTDSLEELARESAEGRWRLLRPHLHQPRWREPLLSCAARLGVEHRDEELTDLVRRILEARSEHEELLHRDLFLAVAVSVEGVTHPRTFPAALVARLAELRQARIPSIRQKALEELARLVRLGHAPAEERFLVWLEDSPHLRETLLALTQDLDESIPARLRERLLTWLAEGAPEVRRLLSARLGRLANMPRVRDTFLSILDDEDYEIRRNVIHALAVVADHDVDVRRVLLARFKAEDPEKQWALAGALESLVERHAEVREAFLARLDNADPLAVFEVIKGLGALAGEDREVRKALLARLDAEDFRVRWAIAGMLGALAGRAPEVREALLARLDDENPEVRGEMVRVLAPVVDEDARVREALLARLEDEDSAVRRAAAGSLGAVVEHDARVREALLARLDDPEDEVRLFVIEALGVLASHDEEVRHVLLARLDDASGELRTAVILALGEAAEHDEEVLLALLPRLGDEYDVRRVTLGALQGLAGRDERVREAFLARLDQEEFEEHKEVLLQTLGPLASRDEKIRETLLARLEGPDRLLVIELLINAPDRKTRQPALEHALRALDEGLPPGDDNDSSGAVRGDAALLLGRLEPAHREERVLQRLLRLLREDPREDAREGAYRAMLRLLAVPEEPTLPRSRSTR